MECVESMTGDSLMPPGSPSVGNNIRCYAQQGCGEKKRNKK